MDIYICTENRGQRIPTLCNLGGISYRCSVVKMLSVFFFFFSFLFFKSWMLFESRGGVVRIYTHGRAPPHTNQSLFCGSRQWQASVVFIKFLR